MNTTWIADRIGEGYMNQLNDAETRLEEKMKGLSVEDPPARLREKERSELQRSILCLMTGQSPNYSMVTESSISSDVYTFFEPVGCQRRSTTKIAFFDGAFEWNDMLTFYMPYLYGEQTTWTDRLNLRTIDEKHRQFLSAGAARVMLPVAPGHEAKVLEFIDTPIAAQDWFFDRLEADAREATYAGSLPDISTNILREILCERNDKYRLGAGKLVLNGKQFVVKTQTGFEQLAWVLDGRFDVGREVLIDGTKYIVDTVVNASDGTFTEDTLLIGAEVDYYLGAVPIGDSWIEYIPTPLVILG